MAGSTIRIEVIDQAARRALAKEATSGTGDLMPRLGEYLQEATQKRFGTQTAPDGTAWAPLAPRYAQRKKYNRDKVLTLRGYLRRSIHHQVTSPTTVEVGTASAYGGAHQSGATIDQAAQSRRVRFRSVAGRVLFAKAKHQRATERWVTRPAYQVTIPARPFLGVGADDEARIQAIIAEWAAERGAA